MLNVEINFNIDYPREDVDKFNNLVDHWDGVHSMGVYLEYNMDKERNLLPYRRVVIFNCSFNALCMLLQYIKLDKRVSITFS